MASPRCQRSKRPSRFPSWPARVCPSRRGASVSRRRFCPPPHGGSRCRALASVLASWRWSAHLFSRRQEGKESRRPAPAPASARVPLRVVPHPQRREKLRRPPRPGSRPFTLRGQPHQGPKDAFV